MTVILPDQQGDSQISGEQSGDYAGRAVSRAGDFNGDGIADFLIGANRANGPDGTPSVGISYLIFGRPNGFPDLLNLSQLNGRNGIRFVGEDEQDRSGKVVAGGGDLNGDGFDDIVIASRAADVNGQEDAGLLHVIYGRPANHLPGTVYLDSLPRKGGFQIEGTIAQDKLGKWVSIAGDLNGDGLDDLSFSATNPTVTNHDDRAYVLYGREALFPARITPDQITGNWGQFEGLMFAIVALDVPLDDEITEEAGDQQRDQRRYDDVAVLAMAGWAARARGPGPGAGSGTFLVQTRCGHKNLFRLKQLAMQSMPAIVAEPAHM